MLLVCSVQGRIVVYEFDIEVALSFHYVHVQRQHRFHYALDIVDSVKPLRFLPFCGRKTGISNRD